MRLAAAAAFLVAVPLIAYGAWLVATPDYDGGRRPVGTLILVLVVPLLLGSIWAFKRPRSGHPR